MCIFVDIDPCDPNPCNNGGACMSNNGQAMCDCPPGRTGSTCGKYSIFILDMTMFIMVWTLNF